MLMAVKEAERPRRKVYLPMYVSILTGKKCCRETWVVRSGLRILPAFTLVCIWVSVVLSLLETCALASGLAIPSVNQPDFFLCTCWLLPYLSRNLFGLKEKLFREFAPYRCSWRIKGNRPYLTVKPQTREKVFVYYHVSIWLFQVII